MNSNQGTDNSRWDRWGTVAFLVYCVSTIFMMFFSTAAVQIWPYPWNRLSILAACLLPLFLVLVWKIPRLIRLKELEKQFLFIPIIIILGILNIFFSEDRSTTLKVMVLFLISGIGIFAVTSYLLSTKFRQTIFLWLCWACLLALCVYGTLEFISKKPILLLSYNPIPAGSLVLLLLVGPLLLFRSSSWWTRSVYLFSILFAIVVIIMIAKRGPILGLLVMAFLFFVFLPWRKVWIISLIALILAGALYQWRSHWRLSELFTDNNLGIGLQGSYSYRVSAYVKGKGCTDLYIWWYGGTGSARNKHIGRYNLEDEYKRFEQVFELPQEAETFRVAFLLREGRAEYSIIYIDDLLIEGREFERISGGSGPRTGKTWRLLFASDFEDAESGKTESLGWWTYSEGRPVIWPWGLTRESHSGRYAIYLNQPDSKGYWLYTGQGSLVESSLRKYLITSKSTVFRLENYPFAAYIFLKKPLFGVGLHAPLTQYLQDYRQRITENPTYQRFIQRKKTLENIVLCGLVEMGGLFSITYIAFIIYLLRNLFRRTRDKLDKRLQAVMFLIPLIGFLIHSMTFDSLVYPHLNWLFHSFLGLMANFNKT